MTYSIVITALISICWLCHADNLAPITPLSVQAYDECVYNTTKTLAQLLSTIRSKYYTLPDIQKAMIQAMRVITKQLDAHSDFYSSEEFKPIQDSIQGEFCGIGVLIDDSKAVEHESLTIIDVVPDGPAEKAGMRAQDKVVEIDGTCLRSKSVDTIVSLFKGPKNTSVNLLIQRTGCSELIGITVMRDIIKDQNATCFLFKEQNIFYLALNMFSHNSIDHMKKLIALCQEADSQGLILDLRNNSGGLLNAVVDIASLFIPKKSLVVYAKNAQGLKVGSYSTTREPILTKALPIFILINNFTASAAEILAGCLRVYAQKPNAANPMIFLAGCPSFGKGSVQEIIPINNDCVAKLTIALYYLPDDSCLQACGLLPDFSIAAYSPPHKDTVWFNTTFGQEKKLPGAIIPANSGKNKNATAPNIVKTPQERRQNYIKTDYVIQTTVRLLGLLKTAQQSIPSLSKNRHDVLNFLKKMYVLDDTIQLQEIKI